VYRIKNFPAIVCGYETLRLRLREENRFEGVHQHTAEDSIQTKKKGKLRKIEQLGVSGF
jgi:hypothetical protein